MATAALVVDWPAVDAAERVVDCLRAVPRKCHCLNWLLATILALHRCRLGKAVVSNPLVPAAVREGLNVESGLNDGVCVPVLLVLLALVTDLAQAPLSLAVGLIVEELGHRRADGYQSAPDRLAATASVANSRVGNCRAGRN